MGGILGRGREQSKETKQQKSGQTMHARKPLRYPNRQNVRDYTNITKPGDTAVLEAKLDAELGGEGDADGGPGAEEIAQGAGRRTQLAETCDGPGLRAVGVQAKSRSISKIVDRQRQRGNIGNEIVAGIVAVE